MWQTLKERERVLGGVQPREALYCQAAAAGGNLPQRKELGSGAFIDERFL